MDACWSPGTLLQILAITVVQNCLRRKIPINFIIQFSVPDLPTDFDQSFGGLEIVTSASGQGAVVQFMEHLYELNCEISGFSWSILPQKLKNKVRLAVMMALPPGYT